MRAIPRLQEIVRAIASDSYENGWRDAMKLAGVQPSVADLNKMRAGREQNADASAERED